MNRLELESVFLDLVEYTTPYGYEDEIAAKIKSYGINLQKDAVGNYYTVVGNGSETLFTCHLDNFCVEKKEVLPYRKGNFITSGNDSILGADNKAGIVILMNLIKHNVPGTYYFFIGEELDEGPYGSMSIVRKNPNYFKKFKRAIAFDRKKYSSIISRQLGEVCCSSIFVDELSKKFKSAGMYYTDDPNGIYTDTAFFIHVIPECTNISNGNFGEHTVEEAIDTDYFFKLCETAIKIDWESLPVGKDTYDENYNYIIPESDKLIMSFEEFKRMYS